MWPTSYPGMEFQTTRFEAPKEWEIVDLISDLHLQATNKNTFDAWSDYMINTTANAVFILGDLFETWIGDDVLDPISSNDHTKFIFEAKCAEILRETAKKRSIFFMRGNRDFLIGESFSKHCDVTLLNTPTLFEFSGQLYLLSHGDEMCLDDQDYQDFRKKVRSPSWQKKFLSQTLDKRNSIALELRSRSREIQKNKIDFIDVDENFANLCLDETTAQILIHGHTHQPADHQLLKERIRIVLSDWDLDAQPPRGEVLRLQQVKSRIAIHRISLSQSKSIT